jgi:hypothetical protein
MTAPLSGFARPEAPPAGPLFLLFLQRRDQ